MVSASGTSNTGAIIDNPKGEMITGFNSARGLTGLNFILFGLITLLYFAVGWKKTLALDVVENEVEYNKFKKQSYYRVLSYFIVTVLIQFWINIGSVNMKCSKASVTSNMNVAAYWTFIPWVFIFAVMMIALIAFPGFKAAFSNIFGYGWISGKTNSLLAELLIDKGFEDKVVKTGESHNNLDLTKDQTIELQQAIVKLFGNMSVLVNKIVPDNFEQFWGLLEPVMKPEWRAKNKLNDEYIKTRNVKPPPLTRNQNETVTDLNARQEAADKAYKANIETKTAAFSDLRAKKTKLLDLVVARDDVGEGFWYAYTAILVMTMTQYFINTVNCDSDPEAMQREYQTFLEKEKATMKATSASGAIVYTVT